jgi:exonuclease VII small subunit
MMESSCSEAERMSFTVTDFNDLKQLLGTHPEWCVELRHLLLAEDFEALPRLVREILEAHARAEERLTRLEASVAKLEASVAKLEASVAKLEASVAKLEASVAKLEASVAKLEENVAKLVDAQRRTDQRVTELAEVQRRMEIRLARVDGRTLEIAYRDKTPAYFGRWLRPAHPVSGNDVLDQVEDRLSADECHEVLRTDLFVRGRIAQLPARPEVWLVVEISCVVDCHDVERAAVRAETLRRAGLPAMPVVAGEEVTADAAAEAHRRGVALLQDGSAQFWDEALAAWPV